tara:strand:+ start:425 stop:847 length:423 start_codon:yes stop_codon:yes gene_type:complete
MTGIMLRTPAIMGRTMFDRLFDEFFNDPRPMIKHSTDGYPLTDIYKDDDDNQVIEMALAGFSKDDLKIDINENRITITSESQISENSHNRRIARRAFQKTFVDYHSQLDFKETKASFENGLLKIVIPQSTGKNCITIEIE